MDSPIYTCFYTAGTLYEHEAARLRASLNELELPHDLRAIPSRGDWQANSQYTATHIRIMQAEYPDRPIVQLDADAVVWREPVLFDALPALGVDIAVHYRRGYEMLNGTVWLAPTEGARKVIELYEQKVIESGRNCNNEQRMLDAAITEIGEALKVYRLPAGYCFIGMDVMKNDLADGELPIVEHLQASREANAPGSEYHANRRKRVAQIDGTLEV